MTDEQDIAKRLDVISNDMRHAARTAKSMGLGDESDRIENYRWQIIEAAAEIRRLRTKAGEG